MTAFQNCLAEIKKAAGRDLSDDEVDDLVTELQRRQRKNIDKAASTEQAALEAAEKYAKDMADAAAIEKRNALLNFKRRTEVLDYIRTNFADDPALGMEAILVGVSRDVKSGRESVARSQTTLAWYYGSGFQTDIEKLKLWKVYVRGELDQDIARALWAKGRGEDITGIPNEAKQIAEVMHKWQEKMRLDANVAGAWIGKMDGYIVRQSHDMRKISQAGYEAWRNEIMPRLDWDRTLEGAGEDRIEEFLQEVYANVASGIHMKAQSQSSGGFKGPRNIAKKASAERVLHFKTADDWFDYNQKFGMGNLRESFLRGLELNAQNTGLMQKLGPNPESNLDQIHQRIMRGIKDPQKRQDLQTKFDSTIRNQFLEVDGSTRSPVHAQRARIAASARAWENLTKLGMALLSQISDLPTHASEMKYQGNRGYLSNVGDAVAGMFYNRSTKERIELEGMLSILRDGMLGDAGVRFSLANDELPGKISRLQQLFFKYNGMTPWTDRLKATAVRAMSHYLALNRASPYSELSPELQRALRIQGIDDARWEILRSGVTKEVDGRQYMIPESVETLPDEQFAGILSGRALKANERNYARVKRELADQLRGYFADRAEFAVVTPDARTRAMMRRGTRPGTVAGEFLRFVGQFKSFPFAVIQKVMGREMYGRGSNSLSEAMRNGNGELAGLAQLMLWTTAFGYIAMSAKDLAKGRTPRDPLDYKTWMAAFVQGGGAGIYGDFLFGEVRNRFGGGIVSTLAGPVAGTVEDIFDLYGRVRDGDDFAAQTFRVTWNHIPGVNIFYTKLALDYFFLWSVQEALNPGAMKRMERRVEKENAQTFLLRPSEVVR